MERDFLVCLIALAVTSGVKKRASLFRMIVCSLCRMCLSLRLCGSLLMFEESLLNISAWCWYVGIVLSLHVRMASCVVW